MHKSDTAERGIISEPGPLRQDQSGSAPSSYTMRFAHGAFWSLVGTVFSRLFALVAAIVAARLLGKGGFGELGMIQSTIGLMGTFAGFGLGLTTTKYVAELKGKDPRRAGNIIALANVVAIISGSLVTLALIASAPWLAQKTLNAPQLTLELRVGSILLLFSGFLGVQNGTLAGFQAFKVMARINFYQGLVALPVTLTLIYFFGLLGAVISLNFSQLIGVFLAERALTSECAPFGIRVTYKGFWKERRTLWDFSFPALLASSMVTPVIWAANAILVNQPNGYEELGMFNAANQFRVIIMFLPNILAMVTIPLLSEIHGKNDPGYFARLVNLNLKTMWALVIPFGFLAIGLSYWLMALYGPQFHEGRPILALMVCVAIVIIAGSTIGQALIASGLIWAGFFLNLGWGLLFLLLAYYFIPAMGAFGLAFSYFISYFLFTIAILGYTAYKFGRASLQSTPILIGLTVIAFLLSLCVGKVSELTLLSICVPLVILSGFISWHLLPLKQREMVLKMVHIKITDLFGFQGFL